MAENDNIEISKKQIAALNSRNLDEYLSRIDDTYVGFSELAPGPVRGREGARQNVEMILSAFPDLKIEAEQIIASGDTVVVRMRVTGTHKGNYAGIPATNKSIVMHVCNVAEIRNGKAVQGRLYADNATLLRDLGVLSLPRTAAAG